MAQQFQKGDHVCYGTNGICLIDDVREIAVAGSKDTFYVLRPLRDCHSTFFIPVRNEALTQKMREPVKREKVDDLIESARTACDTWIEDRKTRMEVYREILRECDPHDLLRLCALLYQTKQRLSASGKKMAPSDESVLKQAEELTKHEFGFALGIPPSDVGPYVLDRLKTE